MSLQYELQSYTLYTMMYVLERYIKTSAIPRRHRVSASVASLGRVACARRASQACVDSAQQVAQHEGSTTTHTESIHAETKYNIDFDFDVLAIFRADDGKKKRAKAKWERKKADRNLCIEKRALPGLP